MMIRTIITIDAERCNGCGLCVTACHEGAIALRDGKARLLRDDYCDGLGDCLPACPTGAISFEEREALPYDEAAVHAAMQTTHARPEGGTHHGPHGTGSRCPGSAARELAEAGFCPAPDATCTKGPEEALRPEKDTQSSPSDPHAGPAEPLPGHHPSALRQWPVQIRLAPVNAPYFNGAHLLVAADCSAYACGDFHAAFMRGRVTLIGCPKLDGDDTEKLTHILRRNDIASVTVVRMSVPCCGGLERAVREAVHASGTTAAVRVAVLTPEGELLTHEGGPAPLTPLMPERGA